MKILLLASALASFTLPLIAQGAPPQNAPDQPYVMSITIKSNGGISRNFFSSSLRTTTRYSAKK